MYLQPVTDYTLLSSSPASSNCHSRDTHAELGFLGMDVRPLLALLFLFLVASAGERQGVGLGHGCNDQNLPCSWSMRAWECPGFHPLLPATPLCAPNLNAVTGGSREDAAAPVTLLLQVSDIHISKHEMAYGYQLSSRGQDLIILAEDLLSR
jgi:hypothetical protein